MTITLPGVIKGVARGQVVKPQKVTLNNNVICAFETNTHDSPLHFSPTGSMGVTLNLEQVNLRDAPEAGAKVQRHLDSGE